MSGMQIYLLSEVVLVLGDLSGEPLSLVALCGNPDIVPDIVQGISPNRGVAGAPKTSTTGLSLLFFCFFCEAPRPPA